MGHSSPKSTGAWASAIASGQLRLQAFGVTESDAGADTTRLTTSAVREGDHYVINGRKIYISRVQHSDLMVLFAPRPSKRSRSAPVASRSFSSTARSRG